MQDLAQVFLYAWRWLKKGSKHVALPSAANKTNGGTVVSILSFFSHVDCPLIYLLYGTQQDAYYIRSN
jgi:hypothetical protein